MSRPPVTEPPTVDQLTAELHRRKRRERFTRTLRSTVSILIVVSAAAVLAATLWLPILQIYGTSMNPTLDSGEYVLALKPGAFHRGDIIAFYYNNKVLVKRCIAFAGQWVDIDGDGNVTVDGVSLAEPYLTEKALGECDIALPYQVPDGRIFVMGDHRSVSVDSRSTSVGCVSEEQIIGRLWILLWPLNEIHKIT